MRISALLLAGLVVLTLTGCQPDDPIVVPQPEPSSTPLFASEEEALAAAEEAYVAYLAVSDAILADGGLQPERLLDVASAEAYEIELKGFEQTRSSGWRSVGSTQLVGLSIQSVDLSAAPDDFVITVYACHDYSGVDVVDAAGESVVAADRADQFPFETSFSVSEATSDLILAEKTAWTGDNFCD